ncbi:MAG TPA: phosphatidylglycerophosphatase A [Rhodocyclaceae bacterium]|nr:phosphatidylglycerophosphatase A [Rhodocyclaceae bacterium]
MTRPTFKFLFSDPAHLLSLGFGSGLSRVAPGTVGSLLAWGIYVLSRGYFSDLGFAVFLMVSIVAGVWIVARTGRALGVVDHGGIVWDEFVAVWLVLWLTPATWLWQLTAVIVFRIFDIVKPWPIRQADKRFKNGFGVMFDDILAAGYTLLIIVIMQRMPI